MGVTLLARWAIEPYIDSGTLRAIRINHPAVGRTWQVATRAGRPTPAFVTDFIGFLERNRRGAPRRQPQFSVIRSVARFERSIARTAGK